MRLLFNTILFTIGLGFIITSCDKVDTLPLYSKGSAPDLGVSSVSVVPAVADSNKPVLTLTWSDPKYATDSSHVKYIIEIDSAGKNFSKEFTKEVTKTLTTSFTGRELNTILLNYGYSLGTPIKLDVRVTSSYSNNNEKLSSNIVKVAVTPYSDPSKLATEKTTVTGTSATSTSHSNTFTWTSSFPGYTGVVTYVIQYDSAGKNFANPKQMASYGGASVYMADVNQGDMNTTGLASGIAVGVAGKVDYRVKATTASGAVAYSNTVSVSMTPFSPVPANLFIVGDATPGGWNNPVPVPSQQFTKIDAYKFSITLGLNGGKSYLFLPVNGDWSHKYGFIGANNTNNVNGDDFKPEGGDMKAPAATGIYRIVVDFQTNKWTVTPVTLPTNLYIVGDATAGGWNNPVPVPSQQFTQLDTYTFGLVTTLTTGKSFLFLPVNGDWNHKFGGSSDGSSLSKLLTDGDVPGSNTPAPSVTGQYLITVNFFTGTYSVVPYSGNLFIVGDATPGGWNNPVPVPSQQFTETSLGIFQLTGIQLTGGKSYLFLPYNGDWNYKFGGTGANNANNVNGDALRYGGADMKAPATTGTYTITVNFRTMSWTVL
ncbi:MAG TPA: SusE domain-containing protein [Flavisolibacter sp.]|nr:SusE domain-containing protein [Flavisolibacter sp.]